jgi:hypothetical protein
MLGLMRRDLRVFCLEATGRMALPWDVLAEGWEAPRPKSPFDAQAITTQSLKQGFVDAGALSKLAPKAIVMHALHFFLYNPRTTATFIRDPGGVLNQKDLEKLAKDALEGGYPLFMYDTNDNEIFADGPEMFADMEWGYDVTRSIAGGQNDAIESTPPKVSVEKVQGKTGAGWKISIAKPYQFYLDAGQKAGEKTAAQLAKKNIFPVEGDGDRSGGSYANVRAKFAK